jgi:ABC-type nitrate/sulfonate/bicarbonate transport system permease component
MSNLEHAQGRGLSEPAGAELAGDWQLSRARPTRWPALLIVVVILAVWEWQVRAGAVPALFFPAPSTIAQSIVRMLITGELLANLAATLGRILLGGFLGGMAGLLLGLAMGWSYRVRVVVDPFVAAAHPIPKIAILPLIMLIFGIGETSKIVVVALAAFFPMLIGAMSGVNQIDPIYFEVARNYGANNANIFTRVVLPGSLPTVLTGARLALNGALLLAIAAELFAPSQGLGKLIWFAWQTFQTEKLYATLIVIALLGYGLNSLLQRLSRHMMPWSAERRR